MTHEQSLPDQTLANMTMLRLAGWSFDFEGINGSLTVKSPDGIIYLYDRGCTQQAVDDAMSQHLRNVGHRYSGSFGD